ncbi:hypothetical protein KYN89_01325 [Alteriqipengyuania sp. NZ-12B]|uniref:Glycerophosphoryl diester phosphodiesterase membrane domain-containing protein n=1 Tax=Alteriqipengyuania abyssalis TaxID=2860200 RepID=A0ABS7PB11_9SPHN|nr:hypothetical protein [Alteriqipengyuania abyssalis]MBY8335678.1 hypothetical protein [Alteriqipengyuania abyssalis]
MERDASFGDRVGIIWSEAWRLLVAVPVDVAIYLLVTIIGTTLADLFAPEAGGTLAVSIGALAAAYAVTLKIVRKGVEGGLRGGSGFPTYFGISFLSGIAIALALLLLIVPGLILWARWLPAYGYGLGEGRGATEALSDSWEATTGHVGPIIGSILLPFIIGTGGALAVMFIVEGGGPPTWWSSLIANTLIYSSQAAGIAIGLAVFSLLARRDSGLAEVFE